MANAFPLVTVIACCYNHERFLVECLEGIRKQTYPNIQIILTDDFSQDKSVALIEHWIQTYHVACDFIKHEVNLGLPRTLNLALEQAKGKYVSLVSMDDFWDARFVERFVEVLEQCDESYGMAYGRVHHVDEAGNLLPKVYPNRTDLPEDNIVGELLKSNFIPAPAVMMRRSCYDKVGYYKEDLVYEDLDMWFRLAKYYKFKALPDVLSYYRIHSNSMMHSRAKYLKESKAMIFSNLLSTNPEYTDIINQRLIAYRSVLYRMGHPLAAKYIWMAFEQHHAKSDLFMFLCLILGFSYSFYKTIYGFLTRNALPVLLLLNI